MLESESDYANNFTRHGYNFLLFLLLLPSTAAVLCSEFLISTNISIT